MELRVRQIAERDLDELLPMMVAYCDFYGVEPGEEALLALARAVLERPHEGVQLLARSEEGEALGFATIYWTWHTLAAARIAVMHDLYVRPEHRGRGVGQALLAACRERARREGAVGLTWETEPDNLRAQRLYEKAGAAREEWVAYWMDTR